MTFPLLTTFPSCWKYLISIASKPSAIRSASLANGMRLRSSALNSAIAWGMIFLVGDALRVACVERGTAHRFPFD